MVYILSLHMYLTGAELTKLRVPVGGDQLTRVRLQDIKSLRGGCHTATERTGNS